MDLLTVYGAARRDEEVARLRRVLALRALVAAGMSQRLIGEAVGITQPAVSQQLKHATGLGGVHPELLVEAAGPVLRAVAADHKYARLAVFGAVARGEAQQGSVIDLVVEPPIGSGSTDFGRFQERLERILDRKIQLVDYGGLTPEAADEVRRDAVPL
ncbi:nucleotidyltransferase domain-containing protein [Angustibacter sp. Root456]|uniref:nucleotidyltransferase domain-containing protein n=1 Tax=Angustibacter sp. Root456 TaxID=1736539 RepID=UPI0006F5696B|nr:nucleotidyltransferase domain-containing protein [Angustibacter sp. Root456]KQX69788.1 Cro/Cl family transcriptional regulator [Angustibacter sp. Root456]